MLLKTDKILWILSQHWLVSSEHGAMIHFLVFVLSIGYKLLGEPWLCCDLNCYVIGCAWLYFISTIKWSLFLQYIHHITYKYIVFKTLIWLWCANLVIAFIFRPKPHWCTMPFLCLLRHLTNCFERNRTNFGAIRCVELAHSIRLPIHHLFHHRMVKMGEF